MTSLPTQFLTTSETHFFKCKKSTKKCIYQPFQILDFQHTIVYLFKCVTVFYKYREKNNWMHSRKGLHGFNNTNNNKTD